MKIKVATAVFLLAATAAVGAPYPKLWVFNYYRMSTDEGWNSFSNSGQMSGWIGQQTKQEKTLALKYTGK